MKPLSIPFQYAAESWMLVVEALTGRCEVRRDGSLVAVTRYDPDLGFGNLSPTLQPMLMVMRNVLEPFTEKIRFLQRA
ncbi:MAG: hypothetical protein H0W83_07950 [Planctomycetes bacterium]|nr:hypothetical protein [Planctomycetota bacterium]